MKIKLEDLWEELEIDESLKEYTENKIDKYLRQITHRVDNTIKTMILSAIEEMKKDIASSKTFSICADTKINKHLLSHCEIPEKLELANENICNLPEDSEYELRNKTKINEINKKII